MAREAEKRIDRADEMFLPCPVLCRVVPLLGITQTAYPIERGNGVVERAYSVADEPYAVGVDDGADKRHSMADWLKVHLVGMQRQVKLFGKETLCKLAEGKQGTARAYHRKVIDEADVAATEHAAIEEREKVERCHVEIGKLL